ncbi:MAG: hypothetical protein A3I61_06020 [Acidobacteria bacterium RIFCSPLOWO2_02_FULL_68_18]|nr:MAG: hypothetical protein A3I61_06020 [Acidobacteria bacterium RIFCSPLOWO2_02_FULL_68_18]OFW52021.1 MAG: hypothetical protein A3G77_04420 [Acidobacteria bacterium RIFCSPLOWO2_12_FULL_68_19]
MLRIGAHMSVAGGVSKAVERAVAHGCEALQIFTKNANQWRGRPLDLAEVEAFRRRIDRSGIRPVVSHASYLINLATSRPALREQSIAAFIDELDRADALALLGVVIHPGTCTAGTEDDALRLIADAIRQAFRARRRRRAMVILEHTAGQGRTVGYRFEHLAAIIGHLRGSARVGICLDTCHLIAAGYDIITETGYRDTFAAFDRLIGLDRLKVLHANDSKRPRGSRVDRHEHIGRGCLGEEPFRRILRDRRLAGLPMLIETEKSRRREKAGTIETDPFDMRNLDTLRRLRGAIHSLPRSSATTTL